ncbi:helix-turn-helix domain-containing protein [Megasphaera elsdenii]
MNPFASRLKALRSRYELTSQQMAEFIGMNSKGSYSKLENGKNPPSCKTLVRTARAFAVDMDYLIGRTQKPYEEELLRLEEKDLFPLVVSLPDGTKRDVWDLFPASQRPCIPETYQNPVFREGFYSLQDRGDILTILHFLVHYLETDPDVAKDGQYVSRILLADPETVPAKDRAFLSHIAWLDRLWGIGK